MPAPVSGPLRSTTSRRALAPRAWPRARDAIPRPSWVGCTPITPRVLTRSGFAAPAADPPLRSDCGGASRRRLRRPAYGRHPTREGADPAPRWTLKRLVLFVRERFARRCCRETIRTALHRRKLSWKQAVVEESQEAAGTGRSGAAGGLCRAAPRCSGRRSTRSASLGLCGRGAHPSGRGPRLWLGRARRALLGRLKLAGPVGAGLVLWAVSLQRGPGAALALSAGQWRPHDRGAATPAGRGSRAQADPALGWCTLSPDPGRPGGRPHVGHRTHAAAGLQP